MVKVFRQRALPKLECTLLHVINFESRNTLSPQSLRSQTLAMSYPQKKLKVAVIGPKGQCGSCVVDELLSRGHFVVGISRNPPQKWAAGGDYTPHVVDLHDTDRFAQALSQDYDAIVCAYGPPLAKLDEIYELCVEGHAKIKEAVLQSTHSGGLIIIGMIIWAISRAWFLQACNVVNPMG